MIERGTGRTSGLTDWQLMDVNSMWACLQDHDTANHWKQVAGWRKVCDLAQTHLGRLQQYRRGLAEAWPPETSAASRTYLAELDELIDKVQRTHDAAAANYTALSAATQAIGTTRAALGKIYEEYATKFQQKQAYESMVADPKAVMGNRATAPPVADGELERLNVQARSMMFNLSGELQQAQATLQKPPAARPPVQSGDPDALTAIPTAPIIPPIIPMPMPTAGNRTASRIAAPDVATPIPQAQGVGPVLGGAGNGLTNNPNTVNTGSAVPPTSAAHPGLGPLPPNAPISPVHITPPSAGGHAPAGSLNRPQALPPAPPARSSPPNGVIGGMPSGGVAPLGPNAAQSRKVNPIGGVIGGGGAGTGPTGGAGSRPGSSRTFTSSNVGPTPIGGAPSLGGNSGIGLPPARHRQQPQFDLDSSRPWDPDNPWETDQGVNPIVQPGNEQGPIDPGPAIGFNR
ncbi:hypothetical protein OG400_10650 [Micromonospora ureilytica]|uniref:hypothetical protein n=1 Tax=Micromonospora ureilytica TaxID=709868 RepID=UPI002E0DEF4F|nr:hypothetical protein OG400_10650 [Micromonospora ureilytica]